MTAGLIEYADTKLVLHSKPELITDAFRTESDSSNLVALGHKSQIASSALQVDRTRRS
ncbi:MULTISPECIES: hypothetical protein [Acidithrix]|uniref:Uncharacterized protein n=1 Tax=Acidithrix ferrooxidans TaxID=1280514 RepID=A0A0D8HDL3_9ACTN|nr:MULTISPECIES: hypothetical protein [Acidithrix]KJF15872.1 hypothetical protein AXFE_32760 [Acidithrix ferrooxidans]CAG4906560.1 unnamed protein product [Acidithrix sp. C25]